MTSYNDASIWYDKAEAFFKKGEYKKAMECYEKSNKIDADVVDTWTFNGGGNFLFDQGNYEEAIEYYNKALEMEPGYKWAWNNKGLALYNLKKYEESINCYDGAIKIDPDNVEAWNNKGVSLTYLNKFEEAIKCYDKAIKIDSNFIEAWNNKGDAFYFLERYEEAIEYYDNSIEVDPSLIWTSINKANALIRLGKNDEALELRSEIMDDISEGINYPDDPSTFIALGDLYRDIGNYFEAEKTYKGVLDSDSNRLDALSKLAFLYSEYLYEHNKALEISRQILSNNPGDCLFMANVTEDLIAAGHYEEARTFAAQVLSESSDPVLQIVIRFLVFASYLFEDNAIKAGKEFARILDNYRTKSTSLKIDEYKWTFNGLINVIENSNAHIHAKFLLLILIDLMQGRIDNRNLTCFTAT